MTATLEEVKTAALALPVDDCDELINVLCEAKAESILDKEGVEIETILQKRLKGPFIQIEDPESYYDDLVTKYEAETARRNANG